MIFLSVPGYDVDSFIISISFVMTLTMVSIAPSKYFKSGWRIVFRGVGTAIITISHPFNFNESFVGRYLPELINLLNASFSTSSM